MCASIFTPMAESAASGSSASPSRRSVPEGIALLNSTSRSGSSQVPSWIAAAPQTGRTNARATALRRHANLCSTQRIASGPRSHRTIGSKRFFTIRPIGGNKAAKKQSDAAHSWSSGEQSRAQQASDETRAQLAEANQAYHAKFGTVFLICATGKSAEEILASARARLAERSGDRTPASPPKNSARSRACAWRSSSPREPPIMSQITTHVLDVSLGRPAAGVPVVLEIKKPGTRGRNSAAAPPTATAASATCWPPTRLSPGAYRFTFDTASYFESRKSAGFYPQVAIEFEVRDAQGALPRTAAAESLRLLHLPRQLIPSGTPISRLAVFVDEKKFHGSQGDGQCKT